MIKTQALRKHKHNVNTNTNERRIRCCGHSGAEQRSINRELRRRKEPVFERRCTHTIWAHTTEYISVQVYTHWRYLGEGVTPPLNIFQVYTHWLRYLGKGVTPPLNIFQRSCKHMSRSIWAKVLRHGPHQRIPVIYR